MPRFQLVFVVTVASAAAASTLVVFGDTCRDRGLRAVAEKFVQIALVGAAAIFSLLAVGNGSCVPV
jgi:hypothetical protein